MKALDWRAVNLGLMPCAGLFCFLIPVFVLLLMGSVLYYSPTEHVFDFFFNEELISCMGHFRLI